MGEGGAGPEMVPHTAVITDLADERLAPYRSLRGAPAPTPGTDAQSGVFVVEGHLALGQLLGSAYPVVSVLVTPHRLRAHADLLSRLEAPVLVADKDVVAATVGFDLHRGVVAAARRRPTVPAAELVEGGGTLVVVEGVNDHENLGALFRNARALGAAGVLLDPTTADPLYRRSIRVSLGHLLRVPFARLVPWPAGLGDLRAGGYHVIALTPDPAAMTIVEALAAAAPSAGPGEGMRVALLVGAEGPGLTGAARAAADVAARIPMAAGVDSLNVATAAAIAMHHVAGVERRIW